MSSLKKLTLLMAIVVVSLAFAGCQKENSNMGESKSAENAASQENIYQQKSLQEPEKLEISKDGTIEMEIESQAEPDNTLPEDKPVFLAVTLKEDTDISAQYTYDTYGKEGAVFCYELKEGSGAETKLEPLSSLYLPQSSEESYEETWLTNGMFLKKGENVFYLNGKDQTFPYRMILKITFFEPEKIESAILYPAGE